MGVFFVMQRLYAAILYVPESFSEKVCFFCLSLDIRFIYFIFAAVKACLINT